MLNLISPMWYFMIFGWSQVCTLIHWVGVYSECHDEFLVFLIWNPLMYYLDGLGLVEACCHHYTCLDVLMIKHIEIWLHDLHQISFSCMLWIDIIFLNAFKLLLCKHYKCTFVCYSAFLVSSQRMDNAQLPTSSLIIVYSIYYV